MLQQLGWKAGPEQYAPVELCEYAIAAEQAGFDMIDVSDHFHPWSEEGQAAFTWTWLGAVAARTKRIHLGTGVTCPLLRYHPAVIAQAAATLSCFAPQRTFLGVGTGEALNEYAAIGLWPDYVERQERLAEAITLIRELWQGEQVSYEGEYYRTQKAKIYTPPASPIPLYVSAMVPESASFAGLYGDGLFTTGGKQPEIYHRLLKNFEDGASSAKRTAASMPRLIELHVAYTDDLEAAAQEMKKYWAGSFIPALFNERIYTPRKSAENGEILNLEAIKKTSCFSSNVQDHVKFAQQYVDLGFTHLIFHCAGPDQHAFLEGYGRDVLPRIRQQNTSASKTPVFSKA